MLFRKAAVAPLSLVVLTNESLPSGAAGVSRPPLAGGDGLRGPDGRGAFSWAEVPSGPNLAPSFLSSVLLDWASKLGLLEPV